MGRRPLLGKALTQGQKQERRSQRYKIMLRVFTEAREGRHGSEAKMLAEKVFAEIEALNARQQRE